MMVPFLFRLGWLSLIKTKPAHSKVNLTSLTLLHYPHQSFYQSFLLNNSAHMLTAAAVAVTTVVVAVPLPSLLPLWYKGYHSGETWEAMVYIVPIIPDLSIFSSTSWSIKYKDLCVAGIQERLLTIKISEKDWFI